MSRKFLVTGAAGFIGSQLMNRLKKQGYDVIGIDNFNSHLYDPDLKHDRVKHFDINVECLDMCDEGKLQSFLITHKPTDIVHLAAMAGVRDSMGNEKKYHKNNIDATQNLIDQCKAHLPDVRIVYASTSCVYAGSQVPWTEGNETGKQLNAYGYTKWANECQFQSSHLHNIGLRFFTVYGPWGRPDMALFDFTKNILAEKEITIYNYGDMKRDFTYVEDILDGIEVVLYNSTIESNEIFNIGRGKQVQLMDFVAEIEKNVGKEAIKNLAPKHPADTKETWSNTSKLEALGYVPKTDVSVGIKNFYEWYKEYNGVE
jgi:UDP-glucuronate 4-epimerase